MRYLVFLFLATALVGCDAPDESFRLVTVESQDRMGLSLRELPEATLKSIGLGYGLAVIRLGKEGLTEAVAKETTRALFDHELIKVKAPGGDREARDAMFVTLAERTGSALVHRIGNVAVLYRPRPDLKRILIPD